MRTLTLQKERIYSGDLILVNRHHPIHAEVLNSKMNLVPFLRQSEILLERRAAACLAQLIDAVHAQSHIALVSGYRSREEQTQLYNDSLRDNGKEFTEQYVAYPDCSEHQTGLAIDLGENRPGIDFICPSFPYSGIFADFRKKAADYGFIERYEQGKENLTGIAHEPWHFRYVGYPHARIMTECNFCLEEYIVFLKDYTRDRPLIYHGKKEFEIYYVAAEGEYTVVNLPYQGWYQISGNNIDGFIVTVWRGLV